MTAQELPAPEPPVTPESQRFWDATAEHRLLVPHCGDCDRSFWYPRTRCPLCGSMAVDWRQASGRGVVYSHTIVRRGGGAYRDAAPYVLAYVELEEGPRVMTNIVGCAPDDVRIGQAVEVEFHDTGAGQALPRFRPAHP